VKRLIVIALGFIPLIFSAQSAEENYERAYTEIHCMLQDSCIVSFKDAVFAVENAWFNEGLDKEEFERKISFLAKLSEELIAARDLIYEGEDKEDVEKYAALFTAFTDSVSVQTKTNEIVYLRPYGYDFHDIWGHLDFSNTFVSKLLDTKNGNCHSLPYLYKMVADEIGAKAHIALAPNHFYIKHHSKKDGWFNTELTSALFPVDAWLMASGYIHLDAIVNRIYMEALSEKQMLALCLIDLANGYKRKLGYAADSDFILKCCETALHYYPHYIDALILQAESTKAKYDALMNKYMAEYPGEILHMPEAQELFQEMTLMYGNIHKLGYREMPEDMYLSWLTSLKEERDQYENKNISNLTTPSH